MVGIIKYGKTGSHKIDFDKVDWTKLYLDLLEICGSQKTLNEFLKRESDRMLKCKTKVVHCKKEKYDVYIGRGSKWGNPFAIGKDGTRLEVIQKYKKYILSNNELIKQLSELEGKILGCWCKPKSCHGDVLVDLINNDIMSKCKTTTKTIYTSNTLNIITRNGEIENMANNKKLNVGSKKDAEQEQEQGQEQERTIEDTGGTWISMSKSGKAIFVTIPVDDLNKIDIQEYTNKEGDKIEQVQLVTSVENLERVLSKDIKGAKLGYFKSK